MLNMLKKTELDYIKCFSEAIEKEKTINFSDNKITDMYCHNFTYIKDKLDKQEIVRLIKEEIERRKAMNCNFLRLEANFDFDTEVISALPVTPEITNFDYMSIASDRYNDLKGNTSAVILEASDDKVLQDGIDIEISDSPEPMKDFTTRKIARKSEVYTSPEHKVRWFVCYYNGLPIGSCELFTNGATAKIEEFSILEDYQRKGFGTSVLKHLLKEACKQGAQTAYVITDNADTAKDMYTKCGFRKIGQKTAAFFRL